MKVTLKKVAAVAFEATAETSGATVSLDGKADIGGEGRGMRPTELLLSGLGGCAGIDVAHILRRQKEPLEDLTIEVSGVRTDEPPHRFTSFHLRFVATGDVNEAKLERAVRLSVEKYCTVRNTLDPEAPVTWEAVKAPTPRG